MTIVVSGEGKTDIGELSFGDEAFMSGPMYFMIDKLIEKKYEYSVYETSKEFITFVPKQVIVDEAKGKNRFAGKKGKKETAFCYKNAKSLGKIARTIDKNPLVALFRDSDGTNSTPNSEWLAKFDSMLLGFKHAEIQRGVPMLPKPKSEAWLLCAYKNSYQNCNNLENESGNDDSPNSLKKQLDEYSLATELINTQIVNEEFQLDNINMASFNKFRTRLEEVI